MATPIQNNPNAIGNRSTAAELDRRGGAKSEADQDGSMGAVSAADDSLSLSGTALQLSGRARADGAGASVQSADDAAALAASVKKAMLKAGALALLAHGAGTSDRLADLLRPA